MGAMKTSRALLAALALCVAACSATYRYHGYVPAEQDLALIEPGVSTRDDVAIEVGQPSTGGLLADGGWYYVRSQKRHYTWNEPEEVSREVLAISFDEAGVVTNIERFGLRDGRVVVLSRRVTDSNVQGISFLRQLLGNIGNFDPGSILGSGN